MDEGQMGDLQIKQKYLREHINPSLYQDFAEFCMSFAGSMDIQSWSFDYVKELVEKFYIEQEQEPQEHEKSFAIYQTSNVGQIVASVISQVLNIDDQPANQKEEETQQVKETPQQYPEVKEAGFKKKKPIESSPPDNKKLSLSDGAKLAESREKQFSPVNQNKSSAVELLDTAFQEYDQGKKTKVQEKKYEKSFFDSANFWEVPKVEHPQSGTHEAGKSSMRMEEISTLKYDSFDQYFNTNVPASQPHIISEKQFTTFSFMTDEQLKKQKQKKKQVASDKKNPIIKIKDIKPIEQKKQAKSEIIEPTHKRKKYIPKIAYEGNRLIHTSFEDQVACIKSTLRPVLSDPKFKIEMNSFEIIHRNFFVSDYVMYHIKVFPTGHICKRNYEDFNKLKNALTKVYPGIQLPYLEKDSWISDTSDEFANKQKKVLQFFLNDVLAHRQLRNSRILEDFLTFPEHKKMKRKFEELDQMAKICSIQQLCLLPGKIDVKISEQHRIYGEKAGKFVDKMQYNLDKYRKNCETLSLNYQTILNTLTGIVDLLKQISNDVVDFNKRIVVDQIYDLDETFEKMRKTYQEQFSRIKFQKQVLDESLLPFIRYEKENIHVSKQIVENCNYMTSRYLKRVESEGKPSKNESYLSNALKDYKQGVLEESKNTLVFQYQTGYINNQMTSEIQRIFQHLSYKVNSKWKNHRQRYLDQFQDSVKFWSTLFDQ